MNGSISANGFNSKETSNDESDNFSFLTKVTESIIDYLGKLSRKEINVIEFRTPDQLRAYIDFNVNSKAGLGESDLLDLMKKVIDYSVHTGHPHYFNTLFGDLNKFSLGGDFLTSALNATNYTFEIAPVFTLMEKAVFNYCFEAIRWKSAEAEGMFCPGGSIANLYGLITARQAHFPEVKKKGMRHLPELAIFVSELAHYSWEKSAIVCGFGTESVYKVATDQEGRIIPSELDKLILEAKSEGKYPLMICPTVGTTVFGAIDPIKEIVEIAQKYKMWVHVDACFGGSMMFLDEFRNGLLNGLEEVDSVAFDPHKVYPVPQQCVVFLSKTKILKDCNCLNADYLFMKDKVLYDAEDLDSGDASINCGRRVDVIKFWCFMKGMGVNSVNESIRNGISVAKYLADLAKEHPNFELIHDPVFLNVSFYYIPNRLLNKEQNEEFWKEVSLAAPKIKSLMVQKGSTMVAYQKQKCKYFSSKGNFFRAVITPYKTKEDAKFLLDEIHNVGKDL